MVKFKTVKCETCKKPIKRIPSHVKKHNFCSQKCYRKSNLHRKWMGG